jgi:hypothetical protein
MGTTLRVSGWAAIAAAWLGAGAASAAPETRTEAPRVDVRAEVAVLNRYVFRGWRYGGANGVVQPSVEASRAGFTAGLWANLDLHEEPTRSFEPHRPGEASLNELDLTLSYQRAFGRVTVGAGWAYYRTWYADPTQEVLVSVAAEVPGAPSLTVYRDVGTLPATYASLALSHALPLGPHASLELAGAFGFLAGDSEAYRTRAPDGTPGPMYRAFHDGSVEAALALEAGRVSVRPSVTLWFPLSSDARRPGHDPAGHLGTTIVFGLAIDAGTEG